MTLITRLGATLIVLAAVLPFVASTSVSKSSCKTNEFWQVEPFFSLDSISLKLIYFY
jgi:hypothetical protein